MHAKCCINDLLLFKCTGSVACRLLTITPPLAAQCSGTSLIASNEGSETSRIRGIMDEKQKKKRKLKPVEVVDAKQDGGFPVKQKKKRKKEANVNGR